MWAPASTSAAPARRTRHGTDQIHRAQASVVAVPVEGRQHRLAVALRRARRPVRRAPREHRGERLRRWSGDEDRRTEVRPAVRSVRRGRRAAASAPRTTTRRHRLDRVEPDTDDQVGHGQQRPLRGCVREESRRTPASARRTAPAAWYVVSTGTPLPASDGAHRRGVGHRGHTENHDRAAPAPGIATAPLSAAGVHGGRPGRRRRAIAAHARVVVELHGAGWRAECQRGRGGHGAGRVVMAQRAVPRVTGAATASWSRRW